MHIQSRKRDTHKKLKTINHKRKKKLKIIFFASFVHIIKSKVGQETCLDSVDTFKIILKIIFQLLNNKIIINYYLKTQMKSIKNKRFLQISFKIGSKSNCILMQNQMN